MTSRSEALLGFAGLIALASCTSSSPPAEPPAPDAATCACDGIGCANGAVLRITTPLPHAELGYTELEVCRQSDNECVRTPLIAGALSADDADTLVFRWSKAIDRNGDRFRVGIRKDDVMLFYAERDVTYASNVLKVSCRRSVNGKNEPCPSQSLVCSTSDVEVLLAKVGDGGVVTDASVDTADATADAPTDAPDAD